MDALIALLVTIGTGLSFWLGALFTKLFKNKDSLNQMAIALALVVMLGLLFLDFIPHLSHIYDSISLRQKLVNIFFYVLLGFVILKLLDYFVPDHQHDHRDKHDNKEEHINHLFHIGVVTSISLVIHNLIEGLSIYNLTLTDLKSGVLMALGVIMHNIPLGISIFATMGMDNVNKIKKMLIMVILSFSSIIGALIIYLLGGNIGEYLQGTLMCVTLGMVIYITVFELFNEFLQHLKSKYTIIGSVLGILIVLFMIFI